MVWAILSCLVFWLFCRLLSFSLFGTMPKSARSWRRSAKTGPENPQDGRCTRKGFSRLVGVTLLLLLTLSTIACTSARGISTPPPLPDNYRPDGSPKIVYDEQSGKVIVDYDYFLAMYSYIEFVECQRIRE